MGVQPSAKLDHRSRPTSRAADIAMKTIAALVGTVALAGAFVLSVAFFAIALVAVLLLGVYLWWKTRGLRRQLRASDPSAATQSSPDVIEGVVISRRWSEPGQDPASNVAANDRRTGEDRR